MEARHRDSTCIQNESELLHNSTGCGSYIEAALYSIGVSSEQLLCNGSSMTLTLSSMYMATNGWGSI